MSDQDAYNKCKQSIDDLLTQSRAEFNLEIEALNKVLKENLDLNEKEIKESCTTLIKLAMQVGKRSKMFEACRISVQ